MFENSVARPKPTQRLHAIFRAVAAVVCVVSVQAPTVLAQGSDSTRRIPRTGSPVGEIRQGDKRDGDKRQGENRREMEAKFQERLELVLRSRLQLTDDQATKLRAHNKRFDVERQALRFEERAFRGALRDELKEGATPNETKIAELLNKWPQLEKKRITIQEREQKDLAAFLQPVQRARFFAFQDEARRIMQETQWGRGDRAPGMRGDTAGGRGQFRGGPPGARGGGGRGGMRPPPRDSIRSPQL